MEHGLFSRFRTASDLDPTSLPGRLAALALQALLFYAVVWATAQYASHIGLLAIIYQPVTGYLHDHAVGLPMTSQALLDLWAVVGVCGFLAVAVLQSRSARLIWLGWAVATTAMVWAGTSGPGRMVATGVSAVAWLCASMIASRGRA